MADGVAITAGAGTTILTDDTGAGGHAQVVKLAVSADGDGTPVPATSADGMLVNLGSNNDVTIPGVTQTQDAAYSAGSLLVTGGVRQDGDTSPVTADGDVHPLTFNAIGRLKTSNMPGIYSATVDTITSNGDTVVCDVSRASNLMIYCTGTFSTINCTFEGSIDSGTTWFAVQAVRTNANTIELTTGNLSAAPAYAWELSVNALTNFRVRATAYTSGTQTWRMLPGSYATEPIPAAQISGTQPISGTVTASSTSGSAAEDAAVSGNPVGVGVRAHSLVPTAMSADNDVVRPWADRSGALVVVPHARRARVTATPTISTSGYVAGDQVGGLLTFTSAALASGRNGEVVNAVITSRTATTLNNLELWLFQASPTIASTDNAAFDITDANLETAQFCGVIDFAAGDWRTTASGAVCVGESMGGPVSVPFVASGSANLFGVLVIRGTVAAQWAGTTDLVVALTVQQA